MSEIFFARLVLLRCEEFDFSRHAMDKRLKISVYELRNNFSFALTVYSSIYSVFFILYSTQFLSN